MGLQLFELCGTDPARVFSPKDAIKPYRSDKLPVLLDGETSVADSWAIATYLEDTYPDKPSLFGGMARNSPGFPV